MKTVLMSAFIFINLSSFAQEYKKSILFDWRAVDNSFYNEMKANNTFTYFPSNNIHGVLKQDEIDAFTRRSRGELNLDLFIQGNKTVIKHHEKNGYNELIIPESVRVNPSNLEGVTELMDLNLNSYGKYWDVFKIDMNLNDAPESYQLPLQLKLNMKEKSLNKIKISLRNNGQIVVSASNKNKVDKDLVFYAGKKVDIKDRFQLEFRLSSEGDFLVFVNNKQHFSKEIPKHFFHDGYANRIWFEGETSIYGMTLEHWVEGINAVIGLSDNDLYKHNRSVAKHVDNLLNKFSIKNQKVVLEQESSSSDFYGASYMPVEPDLLLPKSMDIKKGTFNLRSVKQLAVRTLYSRYTHTLENGKKRNYLKYRVYLLITGTYRTSRNVTEEVSFPISYSLNYPREFKESIYYIHTEGIKKSVQITRSNIKGL